MYMIRMPSLIRHYLRALHATDTKCLIIHVHMVYRDSDASLDSDDKEPGLLKLVAPGAMALPKPVALPKSAMLSALLLPDLLMPELLLTEPALAASTDGTGMSN